jgi:hypothetical protein
VGVVCRLRGGEDVGVVVFKSFIVVISESRVVTEPHLKSELVFVRDGLGLLRQLVLFVEMSGEGRGGARELRHERALNETPITASLLDFVREEELSGAGHDSGGAGEGLELGQRELIGAVKFAYRVFLRLGLFLHGLQMVLLPPPLLLTGQGGVPEDLSLHLNFLFEFMNLHLGLLAEHLLLHALQPLTLTL